MFSLAERIGFYRLSRSDEGQNIVEVSRWSEYPNAAPDSAADVVCGDYIDRVRCGQVFLNSVNCGIGKVLTKGLDNGIQSG